MPREDFEHCPVTGAWVWWSPHDPKRGPRMRAAAIEMLTVVRDEPDGLPLQAVLMAAESVGESCARSILREFDKYKAITIRKTPPRTVRFRKGVGIDVLLDLQSEVAVTSV